MHSDFSIGERGSATDERGLDQVGGTASENRLLGEKIYTDGGGPLEKATEESKRGCSCPP